MHHVRRSLIGVVIFLAGAAQADAECETKQTCHCQCQTILADARATGQCSIAEKLKSWCSISYNGNTGSLGPDSIGPNFSTASEALELPDHRNPAYAEVVNDARNALFRRPIDIFKSGLPPPTQPVALMIRSSYVSAREISIQELQAFDGLLVQYFAAGPRATNDQKGTAERIMRALVGGEAFESGPVTAKRAFIALRLNDVTVRFIWPDLLP